MGFIELLVLLFIALKLISVVTWSWWAVFSPFLAYIVILPIFIVTFLLSRR